MNLKNRFWFSIHKVFLWLLLWYFRVPDGSLEEWMNSHSLYWRHVTHWVSTWRSGTTLCKTIILSYLWANYFKNKNVHLPHWFLHMVCCKVLHLIHILGTSSKMALPSSWTEFVDAPNIQQVFLSACLLQFVWVCFPTSATYIFSNIFC